MQAALVVDSSQPPKLGVTPKPSEPEPSSNILQLKVLATGFHQIVRSRISGQHYSSSSASIIPGIDGVGESQDGQRYYFICFKEGGSFAQYINVSSRNCFPLPSGLDPVQAAGLVNPALSSWMAMAGRCENVPKDSTVLIMGVTSTSGRIAIPLARKFGAKRVVGCARNEDALKMLGLDDYIVLRDVASSTDFSKLGHVDVILDYVYGPVAVHLLKSLRPTGKLQYVHIGSLAARSDPSALEISVPGSVLRSKDLSIRGSGLGSWDLQQVGEKIPSLLHALSGLNDEKTNVKRLIEFERVWNETEDRIVFVP
ncbi:MAG: hypothetical protein Q9219_002378 [cf. Caloplaca sp. 3 TL-2023]